MQKCSTKVKANGVFYKDHTYTLWSLDSTHRTPLQVKLAFTLLDGFKIQLKDRRSYETMYIMYPLGKFHIIYSLWSYETQLYANFLCTLNSEGSSKLQTGVKTLK